MIQEKISGVLDSGKLFRIGEYVPQTLPLQKKGAEIMIAVVCYKSGPVKQAVIILLESTIFKEPQARGQVEQLACSLKTLAAALAHVMQIPLSGVRGMLQLLERDLQTQRSKMHPSA